MSRCGLRKLYFGCKKAIFLSYFTVNRTKFSAQLACARWLLQMLVCCLADFHLFLAKTDYSLPLATLFSNFSTAKKLHSKERKQKPFAAQTPPRKRGYVEDFAQNKTFSISTILTSATALLLRYVHVAYGKIAARQARGYGVLYKVNPFWQECYFSYTQIGNRTRFSDHLAVARWLWLNVSFMFG